MIFAALIIYLQSRYCHLYCLQPELNIFRLIFPGQVTQGRIRLLHL